MEAKLNSVLAGERTGWLWGHLGMWVVAIEMVSWLMHHQDERTPGGAVPADCCGSQLMRVLDAGPGGTISLANALSCCHDGCMLCSQDGGMLLCA